MSEFVVMENVKKTYKMGEVMIHAVDGVDISRYIKANLQ